jgi:hypothetical protein
MLEKEKEITSLSQNLRNSAVQGFDAESCSDAGSLNHGKCSSKDQQLLPEPEHSCFNCVQLCAVQV